VIEFLSVNEKWFVHLILQSQLKLVSKSQDLSGVLMIPQTIIRPIGDCKSSRLLRNSSVSQVYIIHLYFFRLQAFRPSAFFYRIENKG